MWVGPIVFSVLHGPRGEPYYIVNKTLVLDLNAINVGCKKAANPYNWNIANLVVFTWLVAIYQQHQAWLWGTIVATCCWFIHSRWHHMFFSKLRRCRCCRNNASDKFASRNCSQLCLFTCSIVSSGQHCIAASSYLFSCYDFCVGAIWRKVLRA